jgi:hypothetical protein
MSRDSLRDTPYATELAPPASITFPGGSEGRIEYLEFKTGAAKGKEGCRFSWWKEGRMLPRPLDVTEDELRELLQKAFRQGLFSGSLVEDLREMLVR